MYLEQLQIALKNKFDTELREGTHVSDIILCMRQNVLKRIEPTPVTNKQLNFFTSGRAIGDAIQQLAKYTSGRFEIEKEVWHNGIVAHIDLYDAENNIPIECKSMRVKEVKEPKAHHIEQLKNYMAMVNSTKGYLLYQCLMHFDETPFVEFEVTMSPNEIEWQRNHMDKQAKSFQDAINSKDAMTIPGVLDNPDLNWLCLSREGKPNCAYYERCKAEKESKA